MLYFYEEYIQISLQLIAFFAEYNKEIIKN